MVPDPQIISSSDSSLILCRLMSGLTEVVDLGALEKLRGLVRGTQVLNHIQLLVTGVVLLSFGCGR